MRRSFISPAFSLYILLLFANTITVAVCGDNLVYKIGECLMKRFLALIAVVTVICVCLSACAGEAVDKVKQTASEAVSDMTKDATKYSNDNQGLLDDNRETLKASEPTEDNTDGVATEDGNMMATEWDNMVENGEVEDGDGNIGERENADGDKNVDENAAG